MKFAHAKQHPGRIVAFTLTLLEYLARNENTRRKALDALDIAACYAYGFAPMASRRFARALLDHFHEHDN